MFKLIWSLDIFVWGIKAYKQLSKRNEIYDIVLLTGTPYMLFSLARKITHKNKAKLVVQMYDPLSMNNYVGGTSYFREKLERIIMRDSDLIIVHSKLMHSLLCDKYSNQKNKIRFIPFSSEGEQVQIVNSSKTFDKLTILHAGSLQNNRNIDLLISALSMLPLTIVSRITIQLIGQVSDDVQSKIKKSNLNDYIKIISFIDKTELNEYYAKADILLVVDSFKDNINVFFPSKICEYLTFEKVIFILTPTVSESRWVFENSPELCFNENESIKLKNALINMVGDKRFYDGKIDFKIKNLFLPQNTMNQLDEYIKSLF